MGSDSYLLPVEKKNPKLMKDKIDRGKLVRSNNDLGRNSKSSRNEMKLVRTKQFCDEKYKPYDLTKPSVKPSNIPTIKPLSNTSNLRSSIESPIKLSNGSSVKPSNASSVKPYSNTTNTRLLNNRPSIESSTAKPSNASNTRSSIESSAKSSNISSIKPLTNASNTRSSIESPIKLSNGSSVKPSNASSVKPYSNTTNTRSSVKLSNASSAKPLNNTSIEALVKFSNESSSVKPSNVSSVKPVSNSLNTRSSIESLVKHSNASNTRSSIESSTKSSNIPSIKPLNNTSNTRSSNAPTAKSSNASNTKSSTESSVKSSNVSLNNSNSSASKIPVRMSPSAIASKIVPPLKTSDSFESLAECETDNNNHEDFSFSQEEFKKLCTQFALSQTTDCIEILKDSKMLEIKENSETCSKYVFTTKKAEFYNDRPTGNLIVSQGNFFGLSDKMKNFILELKKIQKLYDWQEECLKLDAIAERRNLIYVLPTSGGKTLVSEILMLREVMLRKKNAIFIVPYISIVQEKVQDLLPLASKYSFFVEEYCAGKGMIPPTKRVSKNSIFVCTIEKAQILFDSLYESNRLDEISLVVVDELHMIGDSSRGHNLETLLTKIIYLRKIPIQIVGMSATISNINEIAGFLNADIYTRNFRPIELKESAQLGNDLYLINHDANDVTETFKLCMDEIGNDLDEEVRKRDPDHIGFYVLNVIQQRSSCLIFCSSKKSCENVSNLLYDVLPKVLKFYQQEEKENLIETIKNDSRGICPILEKTLPIGVAYHHSGLTADERYNIENAFRLGIVSVICCTSTLAAGVNLPASLVIIRSPYIGRDFLPLSRYKQMIGRAGRAGQTQTGESIIMCEKKDRDKLIKMLTSEMDDTVSEFINDVDNSLAKKVVLNLIGIGLCKTITELCEFANIMFANFQGKRHDDTTMKEAFMHVLQLLFISNAIHHTSKENTDAKIMITCNVNNTEITVCSDDILTTSKLGKAAVSAGLTIENARKLYSDLNKAQMHLCLEKFLQLFYIVTPVEAVESISLDYNLYNSIYMKLRGSLLVTAQLIGIDEKSAVMMITNHRCFNERDERKLKRFYIALILNELWSGCDIFKVAEIYNVDRGLVNKLMQMAATQAFNIFKFCEYFNEYWVFREIMATFSKKLSHCCAPELLPLMDLPMVKLGRAKLMYDAGIKTICDVAKLSAAKLVIKIKNINRKQADIIIKAARHAVADQIENHRSHIQQMIEESKQE